MKTAVIALLGALALTGCGKSDSAKTEGAELSSTVSGVPSPPVAKKIPHKMSIHGHERIDNYYWMRDDLRKDPEVIAYLEQENDYGRALMKHTRALQDTLFEEITARLEEDKSTVPVKIRDYWYYRRYVAGQEYPVYARKKGALEGAEEVLLDVNALAEGNDYYHVGQPVVSPNDRLLAYSEDSVGRRIYSIRFKDLKTGKLLQDHLENAEPGLVWANDNQTVFYINKDPQTLLGYQVMRHQLGTPQSEDVLVYEEDDTSFYTWLSKSRDGELIYIHHYSTLVKGLSTLDANAPEGEFQPLHPLEKAHEYSAKKLNNDFYILTNWEAENFRLMKVAASDAGDKTKWREVLAHRADVLLEDFTTFDRHLAIVERENGQSTLRIIGLENGDDFTVGFNDPIYQLRLDDNPSLDSDSVRVAYSSLTTPNTIYDAELGSGDLQLMKQDKVPGDFDPARYQSEYVTITARDGAEIPVSLAYRKDRFNKDGSNPLFQIGYGSYGSTVDPRFRPEVVSLLDRGFVFAIAHIRGGQKLGRSWYEDGKMFNKVNTFTDFIDVTKGLTGKKYGAPDKVLAAGGSAGGLLMGAVVNMEPDLYRGVTAMVPFVDVVTTMLDESIPLTVNEYDEWGNPNNKDSYEYMLSYSPYDQVKAQDYPNMLVTAGLHDSQVQYFEPAKWVAKLREVKTDSNRLILNVNMDAGHGGASGRYRKYKDTALQYAFYLDLLDKGHMAGPVE
ncbi:S9 family peptidase [Microbulbifer marinus]|uniref:Oligopeptidase B Serine peptidase. MEROPS family S09A n=1 Tax=Microbulbifer marinus TaxID=658218 RepID=A0A1H3WWT1_9GAMM|nr:S9 family peptidase [Microbulbifer marinus]SDZ91605.1 oligopeptidase B Serine peptidase. MEROPS family S09A [Microbulbifer marinus]